MYVYAGTEVAVKKKRDKDGQLVEKKPKNTPSKLSMLPVL